MIDENTIPKDSLGAEREELKNIAKNTEAKTIEDLEDEINSKYMSGYMHDAFVYGIAAAQKVLEGDSGE